MTVGRLSSWKTASCAWSLNPIRAGCAQISSTSRPINASLLQTRDRFLATEGSEERMDMWRKMHGLLGSGLAVSELAHVLADSPLSGEARGQAKTLTQVDPDVARYHAEGRLDEYVEKVDLEEALRQLNCPVLLLQGDQSQGGIVSNADVEQVLALLADGVYVRLQGKGHDLGLRSWEVTPLLQAITSFLESL